MNKEILYPHFKFFFEEAIHPRRREGTSVLLGKNFGAKPKFTMVYIGSTTLADYYIHVDKDEIHRIEKVYIENYGDFLCSMNVRFEFSKMKIKEIREHIKKYGTNEETEDDHTFGKSDWSEAVKEAEKFLCLI